MTIQRLSAIDIYALAKELNISLSGKAVHNIVVKKSDVYFELSGIIICFKIISGSPYFITTVRVPTGRNWLEQIKGGLIKSISQVAGDRLIMFEITVFNRLGKRKDFYLYFEFYKNGNIILTDSSERVLTELRRGEKTGEDYQIGKPKGLDFLAIDQKQSLSAEDINEIKSLNILQYAKIPDNGFNEITKLINKLKEKSKPHLIKDRANQIIGFSVYGPPFIDNLIGDKIPSVIEAITRYSETREASKSAGSPDIKKRLSKAQKKLEAIEKELIEAEKFLLYRQYGEIILANLNKINKGQTICSFPNPYIDETENVTISLDQTINPEKNAARYFDMARKMEKSVPILIKRLARHKAEIAKLQEMEARSSASESSATIDLSPRKTSQRRPPFKNYKLEGGWQVYLGKSASTNDELTFSFAKKDDIWFHAWQAFGSHLILRSPQKGAVPDNRIILQAASLAAYFSRAKHSGKVPVVYTEVRYVRKIKKILGKVTYTNEKSLMVEPKNPDQILESK